MGDRDVVFIESIAALDERQRDRKRFLLMSVGLFVAATANLVVLMGGRW